MKLSVSAICNKKRVFGDQALSQSEYAGKIRALLVLSTFFKVKDRAMRDRK